MKKPDTPFEETERVAALCALEVLDTPAEARFDRVTRIAQRHFQVPIALVSLVDAGRQWFKSRQGLDATETPRDISFCGHAILGEDIFHVPDALEDPRFADNPLVTGMPHVRFYAGAPLRAPGGECVGTLCIIDRQPRKFGTGELAVLRDLADCVEAELERTHLHLVRAELQSKEERLQHLISLSPGGIYSCKASGDFRATYVSEQVERVMGYLPKAFIEDPSFWLDRVHSDDRKRVLEEMKTLFEKGQYTHEYRFLRVDGGYRWINDKRHLVRDAQGDPAEIVGLWMDVTERKQDEATLAAKTQLLHDTFENMAQGISVVDRDLRMVGWNRRFLELLDFPESLFHEGTCFEDVIRFNALRGEYGPGDAEEQVRARVELAKRFAPHVIERVRPDGRVLEIRGSALAEGGFVTTYTDITERKRDELQLRSTENRLRAIIDTVVDGIVTIDGGGVVQTFNPAAEGIFGYAAADVIGRNVRMLMPEPYHSAHDGYLHHYLSTGERKVIGIGREVIGQRKDGSTFPIELAVSEMQLGDERHFTGVVRDIGQRKAAEAELKGLSFRLTLALESARLGTWDWDVEHNLLVWDDRMYSLYGVARETFAGAYAAWLAGVHPDDRALCDEAIRAALHGERPYDLEFRVCCPDGTIRWIKADGQVLRSAAGKAVRMVGINYDITERKNVERMKSEFVSTVSHELRTPLTSIRGALSLLLGRHAAALPEHGRRLLDMATRNSERLTLLINDILDLEKLESGSLDFEFKALDLAALAQHALAANEGYAHQHGVRLRLAEVPQGASIQGDEHRLLQVFANLLSNAIKYSPREGEVVVAVGWRGGRLRVSVKDHGRGIPAEFRSRMFQRFAQADSSDTRERGGTGLGLSVTKAIVERHGGTIDYASEVGVGTEFFFELPAWQETVTGAHGEDRRPLLLICEDNADVARVLGELLASEGLASDVAATAAGAKSLLAERRYQALLLDLSLPDQDGLALITELRAEEQTRDLPIIVVSGRASDGRAAWQGDALAVIDWLQKPVDEARLAHAIHQALAGHARPRLLHVEDDPDVVQVTQALVDGTVEYFYATTLAEARGRLAGERFDLVLLDLLLPDGSGLDLLEELKGRVPVILFSGLEPGRALNEQVAAALVKTRTSNEQLLETIKRTLHQKGI